MAVTINAQAAPGAAAVQSASVISPETILQVARELAARPFLPSVELGRKLELTREELKAIYAAIQKSAEAQAILGSSPFYYLTKVLERLSSKDARRVAQILRGENPQPLFETLELFISADCNVNCSFCYRRDRDYGDQRILGTQEFLDIIDEFVGVGGKNMDVSGGLEPLLSPAINDVLKRGVDRGLRVNLYTIGNALHNPKITDSLMRLSQIRVSFTAHDRESYKFMMGVDHFDRVTTNLHALMKEKLNRGATVGVGTSYVVTPAIYRNVPKAVEFAMGLGMEFFDLRSVSVWEAADYTPEQRAELGEILAEVRRGQASGAHGKLKISIADTFSSIVDPRTADPIPYVNHDLVNALFNYRVTVTPAGKVFPLNILGQPTREDEHYLIGYVGAGKPLMEAIKGKKPVRFDPTLLLAHDKSLIIALSKLKADVEFGIGLEENPFARAATLA